MSDGATLDGEVGTDRYNPFVVAPFSITALRAPAPWDVADAPLPLAYVVCDPNGRIAGGRLVCYAPRWPEAPPEPARPGMAIRLVEEARRPAAWEVVHVATLEAGDLTDGPHELGAGRRWDGAITLGADAGRTIGAHRAPLRVVLEAWNEAGAPSGTPPDEPGDGDGDAGDDDDATSSASRAEDGRDDDEGDDALPAGAALARAECLVEVDGVASGAWARNWCIPYDDPDEPDKGGTNFDLRVRNVPDGTPVRLLVARIGALDDPKGDLVYECTGRAPDAQPGLEGALVRGTRIRLADGTQPWVRWSNYDQHWVHPGNNFYAVWVSYGDTGRWQPATARDAEGDESACCHMRFTVYIRIGGRDNPRRVTGAQQLRSFLSGDTKYFRPYLQIGELGGGGSETPEQFLRRFRHRFICIFVGHGFGDCAHETHPRNSHGSPRDHFHSAFPPDDNRCPDTLIDDEAKRAEELDSRSHYSWEIGPGCGHRERYRQLLVLGNGLLLANYPDREDDADELIAVGRAGPGRQLADAVPMRAADLPRFYWHMGGCRTAVTDRMAQWALARGTRYAHGWVYSVDGVCNIGFAGDLLRRWIDTEGSAQGLSECDPERFERVYHELAREAVAASFEPRLRTASGTVTAPEAPDAAAAALE